MRRTRSIHIVALLCFFTLPAMAGEFSLDGLTFDLPGNTIASPFGQTSEKPLVSAKLLPQSETIAPGTPFKIALELQHAPDAYTYWQNPGGPGQNTRVEWSLPAGFTVSGPEWPAPQLYHNGPLTSYIFKGTTRGLYTITPPASLQPGESIALSGQVKTQVCTAKTCNPVTMPVTLDLAVAATPGETSAVLADAENALPDPPRGWRYEISEIGEEVVIAMYPSPGSNPNLSTVYFYDLGIPEPVIDSQKPQTLEKDGGVWWLRLPLLADKSLVGTNLRGVLQAENGWLEANAAAANFAIDLPVGAEGQGRPPGLQKPVTQRPYMLLLFAFLGGLLLNVMPCVFPVIGLKIMGFAKQAHKDRRAVFLHGLAYAAGVLLCFWTLSFLVITMGRGWGAQLQSEWFLFALCHIFMIMSLNMAGVFEVGASVAGATQNLTGNEGLKRSFLTGLLATITSTPCSAPFLGTALAYALSLPPILSLGVFTLMGLGFSFPYLALSLFPNWLKKLPKPGPWMDTFRQAMCFPLFATTAYMFWTMEAMTEEWQFLMLLFGLVLTAMACWLYGKSQKSQVKRPRASRILFFTALFSLLGGLWLGHPESESRLQWQEWSPEIVSRLREEGRPVYVDFTARWCATCQVNKRVYKDSEVAELLLDKNVALLKADWTQYDDRITSTLKGEFNKAAVPVTVLYPPGENRGTILPEILTVGNVSSVLEALP